MIAIIDYGMGNMGSIQNMLKKIGASSVVITDDDKVIMQSDGIILPGVGSYDMGVSALQAKGLFNCIKKAVIERKIPILGICLGMQLLGKGSEEGVLEGLDLINFTCKKFVFEDASLRVPHMGWNYISVEKPCQLSNNLPEESRFYFVHSYRAVCEDESDIFMSCDYGYRFTAAVHKNNIYGVQFHPEKSHKYGMCIMRNFVEVCKNV